MRRNLLRTCLFCHSESSLTSSAARNLVAYRQDFSHSFEMTVTYNGALKFMLNFSGNQEKPLVFGDSRVSLGQGSSAFVLDNLSDVCVLIAASNYRFEMEMYLKRFFFMIFGIFLCSCAGTGHQGIVKVPGQDVSFMSPPLDWESTLFTSTSKMPTGGFLPIKFFKASWSKSNLSTIGITGANISGIKKEGSTRAGLISALEKELIEFKKVCGFADYSIKNEINGTLREGIYFTGIDADIICILSDSNDPLRARTILYVLESMDYFYTLQFKAIEKFYNKDIIIFEQILDSIAFAGH